MIYSFIVYTSDGTPLYNKWHYRNRHTDTDKETKEIFVFVNNRTPLMSNFTWFKEYMLVYRTENDLLFVFCCNKDHSGFELLTVFEQIKEALSELAPKVDAATMMKKLPQFYRVFDNAILGGEVYQTSVREMVELGKSAS